MDQPTLGGQAPQPEAVGTQPSRGDLFEVMSTMRTMRRLKADPIPRELIERLIQAASWAPSGGNSQTATFVVVDDRTQIARIAPLWRRAERFYVTAQGDACPPTMSQQQWQRTLDASRYLAEHFEEVPALILVCSDVPELLNRWVTNAGAVAHAFGNLGVRQGVTTGRNFVQFARRSIAASVYPAVENLLLAARCCGLAASLTTWHVLFEQELKAILGIPKHVSTFAAVPIGYPKGRFGPVNRAPVAQFLRWNHW
jgi:nitroreductase